MRGLPWYVLKRVLAIVIVVVLIATAIFQVFFLRGDPAATLLPKGGSPGLQQALRDDLKLNEPLPVQYLNFMMKVLSGKFFISMAVWRGANTSARIYDYAATTLALFAAVLIPSMALGRVLAWVTTRKDGSRLWSRIVRLASLGLASMAATSAGIVVLSLTSQTSWIPIRGSFIGPWLTAFPIALGTYILIMIGRGKHFRAERIEVQTQRPIPTNPMTKLFVAWTMVIVIVVEIIFSVSGLGLLMWQAVNMRDATVLIACVFLVAVMIALANFALDLASPFVNDLMAKRRAEQSWPRDPWISNVEGKTAQGGGAKGPTEEARKNGLTRDFVRHPLGLVALAVLLAFIVLAALAPVLATVSNPDRLVSYEPNHLPYRHNPLPPSFEKSAYTGFVHPLGTDNRGRDVYSLLLYGTAGSLEIVGILMAATIGAGLLFWLLAAASSLLPEGAGMIAGGISSVVADFIVALPAFLVIVMQAFPQGSAPASANPYLYGMLVIAPALVFACSFRAARVRMPTIRGILRGESAAGTKGSGLLTVMSKSAGTVFYVAKFVVLIGFLTMFVAGFFVWFVSGIFDTSWISLTQSAYDFGEPLSGTWWTYVPQLLLSMLLIGSSYALLHTLEKVFVRKYGTLGTASKPPPA